METTAHGPRELSCSPLYRLAYNDIGSEGAEAFAPALAANASLTKISLASNNLMEDGTRVICEAVKGNKTLKELDLRGDFTGSNIGGSAGAKHVADMLGANASLTDLNLASNKLAGETDYVNATKVQGSSFNVGDKVAYEGREMVISEGKGRVMATSK